MLKNAQIKSREFLNLVKPVYKRVSVNVQLTRRFGNVEIVLKEFLNCIYCFLIQNIYGFLLEHLF